MQNVKWQRCAEAAKCYCVECGGRLRVDDLRPKNLAMRVKYPGSQLYVCADCGCCNLVSRVEPPKPGSVPPVRVGVRPEVDRARRRREIMQRLARNRRACLKLKELIDADKRLLKALSQPRQR